METVMVKQTFESDTHVVELHDGNNNYLIRKFKKIDIGLLWMNDLIVDSCPGCGAVWSDGEYCERHFVIPELCRKRLHAEG